MQTYKDNPTPEQVNLALAELTGKARPYCTSWAQAGPLIEQYSICLDLDEHQGWLAAVKPYGVPIHIAQGETALIAAMRCLVLRLKLQGETR